MIQNWNMGLPDAIPPFTIFSRVLLKIKQGDVFPFDFDCTSFEYPTMVPRTLKPLCQETSAAAKGHKILKSPKNIVHSLMVKNSLTLAVWLDLGKPSCVRKTLLCEGISENASHIIVNFRRKGRLSNYESGWRKWGSWCLERKIDPFQAPVKDIIAYLTFFFNYGNEYRTINLHR